MTVTGGRKPGADPQRPRHPARARRNRLVLAGALAAAGVLAWPVIGQPTATQPGVPASETDAPPPPKSLLPDSFDGPSITSNAQPAPPLLPGAADGQPPLVAAPLPGLLPGATPAAVDPFAVAVSDTGGLTGPLTIENGGFGVAAFDGSRGRFLAGLNKRMTAPLGSRWAAITLRRALMSKSATPYGIATGDWVASRALLLARIGEIDGAKALVDGFPIDRYTPELYRVAGLVALAAADIGGLCPIAVTGRSLFSDPMWQMAVGMCAAMQGDDITAANIFDDLRKDSNVEPFDVRLGERVATIAGGAGRASNINWDEAPSVNLFRYGLAAGAGVALPADKLDGLGPARFGWLVRSAGVAPEIRLAALRPAAVMGSVSVAELSSGIAALSPGNAAADTPAGRQRIAFAGASLADRRAALREIRASGGPEARYGGLLESASATARLPVSAQSADDSADIIAALLAAGNASAARRWWPIADAAGGKTRAAAWALLAAGGGGVPVTSSEFSNWRSTTGADDRRAALLLSARAGHGNPTGGWGSLDDALLPRAANSWTRAIDAAAAAGRSGEVAILAATGLQGRWSDVPPLHLYHVVAALTRVGHAREARLIAAEAVTRA
jgi:hypothetical protein